MLTLLAPQGGLVPTEAEAQCPVLLATLEKEKQQTDHQEETGLLKCQAEALPGQQITPLKVLG